jgi:hypothetical protein
MQTDMPEMGEVETDPNPQLGMVNRQMASKWIPSVRGIPNWLAEVTGGTKHISIINEQVSSSGYSASQEAQGHWGHGTMPAAIGIEPVGDLRDGGKMGNEYFVTNDSPVQMTADNTMMSPAINYDQGATGRVAALGKVNARKAAQAAQYDTFWNGGQ